jgi:UDP-glucose-4-epimerase GalE
MAEKKILVTGGAGYIGSFACKALKENGYLPIVFDNLSTGHKESVRWGPFIYGDLEDSQDLDNLFKKHQFDAVMHFAASAIVSESTKNPSLYYTNNVKNTILLLEAMRKNHVNKLIFSSSCATYGNPVFSPITEQHPQNPINPYGTSKWMIEKILEDYHLKHDLSYVSLRYFNAAGADPGNFLGENHANETHIIPLVIETAFKKRDRFTIYGNTFPTKDGTAIRDYIHVLDIADAHLKACSWLENNMGKSLVVNLGTCRGYSILEIINMVEKLTDKKVPFIFAPIREGEPSHLVSENTKARMNLGWAPEHSDLEKIIAGAIVWHENLLSLSKKALI